MTKLGGKSAGPAAKKKSFYSSWVVTFDQQTPVVSPPQMAFGTSLPPRDPGGLLVAPTKGTFRRAVYRAAGRGVTFTAAPTHPHFGLRPTKPIREAVPDSTGDSASTTLRFVEMAPLPSDTPGTGELQGLCRT